MSSRRRIALLLFCLAAVLVSASAVALWRRQAPSMLQRRLQAATGRHVTVGAVGLTWQLQLIARQIDIAGAPPFESQSLIRIERAIVRLHGSRGLLSPSEIVVDGADIEYLATAAGDNVRGVGTARRSPGPAAMRTDRAMLPAITVRNARLRGSIALPHGPHVGIRAPDVEVVRDVDGRLHAHLHRAVVDAEGMASVRALSLDLEMLESSSLKVVGRGLALEIPGGGTLLDDLYLDGQVSPSGSSFDLHRKDAPERQAAATLHWNGQSADLVAELHALPLRALGPLAGGRALGLENGTADLRSRLTFDRADLQAHFEMEGKVSGIDVIHPAIDVTPWRNQAAAFSVRGQYDLGAGRLDVQDASFKGIGAALRMSGFVENPGAPRGSVTVSTAAHEPLSCASLLFGQPEPVQRALAGLDLQGNLGFNVSLTFDSTAWQDLQLAIAVDPICSVKSEPRALSDLLPVLRKPKTGQPPAGFKLPVGAYHPDFVPLSQMPVHLPSAFITSEDSKFFHHRGFDTEMIRSALAQDLGNRSFERGASTITQQLAKNLFLTHRRSLARKLEEAVLTWRLQKLLSKDRILEIYLNIIELGPGIQGIKQAAQRYFGKDVADLVPIESAHLAALTPNPHVLARRFRDGQIDEGWQQRLYDLLGMMKRHHRLSAEELAAARTTRLELRDLGGDLSSRRQD